MAGIFGCSEDFGLEEGEGGACAEGDSRSAGFGEGESCCATYAFGGARYEDVLATVVGSGSRGDGGVGVGVDCLCEVDAWEL